MSTNRSRSRKESGKIAFCGLMVALSVVLMLSGGLIPIATYCAPMAGGLLLLPILLEYGKKPAWTAYAATSLITLLLGADKEAAFFYLFSAIIRCLNGKSSASRTDGFICPANCSFSTCLSSSCILFWVSCSTCRRSFRNLPIWAVFF